MKTICIGGTSSNCGKTSLSTLLLRALPGWAAVKVTPCRREAVCPCGGNCGACEAPESSYEIITDPVRLSTAGKDTDRFLRVGASRVAWVRALPEALPEALEAAFAHIAGAQGVIVESTSAIPLLTGLRILVTRMGESTMKESARRSTGHIDFAAVNFTPDQIGQPPEHSAFAGIPSLPVCAIMPPRHVVNRPFIEYCQSAVRRLPHSISHTNI